MKINRKYAAFIITLLLTVTFLFGAPTAYAAAFYTDVRVLLSVDGADSISIDMIGDYYLKEDPSFVFESGEVVISKVGSRPVLTCGESTFTASSITLSSLDYDGVSSYIRLTNSRYGVRTYLGDMTFDVTGGKIRVINKLPIEHYLYGVVPYEMSNTFPIESLKAQAVCARGYAVANCSKYRLRAYDILDTSADQVYHGYVSKYTRAIAAVDETFGQILTYEGDIIQAYYAASNGGQTELTGNVWASDLPYYIHRDDIYDIDNPSSLEEKSFIPTTFSEQTLPLMDTLVLNMLQEGANDAAGEAVTLLAAVRIKAHSSIYNPPSRLYTKADVTLMVMDSGGKSGQLTITISLDALVHTDDNHDGIFNTGSRTLRVRGAEPGVLIDSEIEHDGWFLTNRRYGHGVGMSQRGAQQRATDGQSYAQILDFYYAYTQLNAIGTFQSAPKLTSDIYHISPDGISGIDVGTSVQALLSGIASEGEELLVISSNGAEKPSGTLSTGDFVRTAYNSGNSYYDLAVVIFGDTDGDGKITQDDLNALRAHLMNTGKLVGVYLAAADLNHDGEIGSLDVLRLVKHLQSTRMIEQLGGTE